MNFYSSTLSKSQSNSLSLSDWSLEEPTPQLYRKEVEHPDLHPTLSPSTPKFHKPLVHHTMITWFSSTFLTCVLCNKIWQYISYNILKEWIATTAITPLPNIVFTIKSQMSENGSYPPMHIPKSSFLKVKVSMFGALQLFILVLWMFRDIKLNQIKRIWSRLKMERLCIRIKVKKRDKMISTLGLLVLTTLIMDLGTIQPKGNSLTL